MSSRDYIIPREDLAKFLPNERARSAFEIMQRKLGEVSESTDANLETTNAMKDAFFVTLSPNTELPNERVLAVGPGLQMLLSGSSVTLDLSMNAARATGGFQVTFVAAGDSSVAVPLTGVLATRDNAETLTNKTLAAPKLSGLGDYVDDAAAAAGGVPVGGIYRNGSVLMQRVA